MCVNNNRGAHTSPTPQSTYEKILEADVEFPTYFSRYARDIVKKLLQKDVTRRIGNLRGGARDITAHAWFAKVEWPVILRRGRI